MSITLHTVKSNTGSRRSKKRVGRGNSSGHGTYATRGLKGQKSRSGASGLKRIGLKTVIRSTPKLRGFKSDKPKNQPVNLGDLNRFFKDGGKINPKSLAKAGLIGTIKLPVKILGNGRLNLKDLEITGIKASGSVKEMLKKNNCKITE